MTDLFSLWEPYFYFQHVLFFCWFWSVCRTAQNGEQCKNPLLLLIYDHTKTSVEFLFGAESFHADMPVAWARNRLGWKQSIWGNDLQPQACLLCLWSLYKGRETQTCCWSLFQPRDPRLVRDRDGAILAFHTVVSGWHHSRYSVMRRAWWECKAMVWNSSLEDTPGEKSLSRELSFFTPGCWYDEL